MFPAHVLSAIFLIAGNILRNAPFCKWHSVKVHFAKENHMNGIIYLVGLVVIVLAVLSLIGLR